MPYLSGLILNFEAKFEFEGVLNLKTVAMHTPTTNSCHDIKSWGECVTGHGTVLAGSNGHDATRSDSCKTI